MKKILLKAQASYFCMSWLMKKISIICVVAGLGFSIGPLLPFTKFTINGVKMTYVEAWKTGYPLVTVLIGLLFLYIAKRLLLPGK
ncbi:MAG: hypothetical protein HQM16_01100 [Deltaproteobacteria bacterium]|nr:hypothetical protein [Deltaproteobacteria bacterium]